MGQTRPPFLDLYKEKNAENQIVTLLFHKSTPSDALLHAVLILSM